MMRARIMALLAILGSILLGGPELGAQVGPGPHAAFPSLATDDGRMVATGCEAIVTLTEPIYDFSISVPATETELSVSIFDGDTGGMDGTGASHWDVGDRQLLYTLFFDPTQAGVPGPADAVATWTGNDPNPLASPDPDPDKQWVATAAVMPDNDWWGVTLPTSDRALGPAGGFHYLLRVAVDGSCAPGEPLVSDFKLATSNGSGFATFRFGFEGSLRNPLTSGPILYDPFDPPNILSSSTTYDGTFRFFVDVEDPVTELRVFDGDLDFGTNPTFPVTIPSGHPLPECMDTDDPDTPASYAGFPFPVNAEPEGAKAFGLPAEDSAGDLFRRGEPGQPQRLGCVRFELEDPEGTIYRNDDPSSNLEWEQFRIATALAPDPDDADYGPAVAADASTYVTGDTLPAGIWQLRFVGLDLSNLDFVSLEHAVCAERDGAPACPDRGVRPATPVPDLSLVGVALLLAGIAGIGALRLRH